MKLFKKVSTNEMKHSSRGIFQYTDMKPTKMIKGGHGNDNLNYLDKNNLSHGVDSIYDNGVRLGHIDCHKEGRDRRKNGHAWFGEDFTNSDIEKAGVHVTNLVKNQKIEDHKPMNGKYKGIDVVTYKSHGRICGVCPKFKQNSKLNIVEKDDENEKK